MWSLQNFCITWKLFREINFIVKLFNKEVTFTKIFQKTVIQKFCKLHTVLCVLKTEIYSHFFGKNFVKATFLLKTLLNSWFDEIFFSLARVKFSFFHTFCEMHREIHCHAKFSSNQFAVKFFSKTLIWRKICKKKTVAVKFSNFHCM